MNSRRNVWIVGHSAGAHLAASILHDELWQDEMTERSYFNLLKGIVLIGGIFNLKHLLDTTIIAPLKLTKLVSVFFYELSTFIDHN